MNKIDPECRGKYEWTEWFNLDSPDGDGDLELLTLFGKGCPDPTKYQIETTSGIEYTQTGQLTHLNTTCFGFMCLNREQQNEEQCLDYQIRQCCLRQLNQDDECQGIYLVYIL